jgi:plastocyanin
MTRAAVAAVAVTAAVALGLVPGPFPGTGDASAGAAECAWQRHSERVVKQVGRHGHRRRLARKRHWWTCDPLAPPPLAVQPPSASAPTPSSPATEPEAPEIGHLGVKADEYSFTLSRPTVPPGATIVELNNQGEDPHDLRLQLEGSEDPPLEISEAGPLEHRVGHFTLAAGTYRLWCSLPQHDEKGMHATLVVGDG